jgi:hypothetical protein
MARIYGAGAGGGGGGKGGGAQSQPAPRTPVIDPDSLNSKQYAQVLDLISEGEIEGLKTATNPSSLITRRCKMQTVHTTFRTSPLPRAMARKIRLTSLARLT